jgi:hypothetical protein
MSISVKGEGKTYQAIIQNKEDNCKAVSKVVVIFCLK